LKTRTVIVGRGSVSLATTVFGQANPIIKVELTMKREPSQSQGRCARFWILAVDECWPLILVFMSSSSTR
jgi:hypothetical protein